MFKLEIEKQFLIIYFYFLCLGVLSACVSV